MTSFEPVRAIIRGLDVLRILNEDGPSAATAIARRVQLPQPTVIRLLETLMSAGYVYKLERSNIYGVTARTLALSSGFDANSRIVQLAQPLIEDLRAEIGWPCSLAVYVEADAAMSIVYTNRNAHGMSMPSRLGVRLPLLVTAVGTVFLASLSADELAPLLTRLKGSKSRWDTDSDFWSGLDDRLSLAQQSGYALAADDYLDDIYDSMIWAVAVPVRVHGQPTAALSTMVLRNAGQQSRLVRQVLPALQQTADQIGARLTADIVGPGKDTQ